MIPRHNSKQSKRIDMSSFNDSHRLKNKTKDQDERRRKIFRKNKKKEKTPSKCFSHRLVIFLRFNEWLLISSLSLPSDCMCVYACKCFLIRVELLRFRLMISLTVLIISRFLLLLPDFSISYIEDFDMISRHRYICIVERRFLEKGCEE